MCLGAAVLKRPGHQVLLTAASWYMVVLLGDVPSQQTDEGAMEQAVSLLIPQPERPAHQSVTDAGAAAAPQASEPWSFLTVRNRLQVKCPDSATAVVKCIQVKSLWKCRSRGRVKTNSRGWLLGRLLRRVVGGSELLLDVEVLEFLILGQ
jgi:hypothetical protein